MDAELDIWREACRHIEIEVSLGRIAPILGRHFPIRDVVVRRINAGRQRIETVAVGTTGASPSSGYARVRELAADEVTHLMAWFRSGAVRKGSRRKKSRNDAGDFAEDMLVRMLVPEEAQGEVLMGPLRDEEGLVGALLLIADGDASFSADHLAGAQTLLEPFAVALANDQRVRELARLREAVEAENRVLLTKLQRDNVVDHVVGVDRGLRAVMERVEQVAPTDVPVLIFGETGSGKEVIARAIHTKSRRSRGPVVRVNCGAIPTELVDSTLFGHEKGSFTGAVNTRQGWFERADGGTLFLDEVGELPLAAQVRLLRILQDGTLERVGGQRTIAVDVRVVAATHRDLQAMVESGSFREDLWYRISVFPLTVPPLRDRIEDLPSLASYFAARVGERLGSGPLELGAADLDLLFGYSWPGNVRELAAVIERAAILGHGRRLDIASALGTSVRPSQVPPPPTLPTPSSAPPAELPPVFRAPASSELSSLDRAMADHIVRALQLTRGRIEGRGGAADLLEINPHTLRARMRKLGIQWSRFRDAGIEA